MSPTHELTLLVGIVEVMDHLHLVPFGYARHQNTVSLCATEIIISTMTERLYTGTHTTLMKVPGLSAPHLIRWRGLP